jgi:hypothetical protein
MVLVCDRTAHQHLEYPVNQDSNRQHRSHGTLCAADRCRLALPHDRFLSPLLAYFGSAASAACLAHHLIRGRSLAEIREFANRLASWVATLAGATPRLDHLEVHNIITGIGREEVQSGQDSRSQL